MRSASHTPAALHHPADITSCALWRSKVLPRTRSALHEAREIRIDSSCTSTTSRAAPGFVPPRQLKHQPRPFQDEFLEPHGSPVEKLESEALRKVNARQQPPTRLTAGVHSADADAQSSRMRSTSQAALGLTRAVTLFRVARLRGVRAAPASDCCVTNEGCPVERTAVGHTGNAPLGRSRVPTGQAS